MKKLLLILFIIFPVSIFALDYPEIDSKIVEIYDINDNNILYEVKSSEVVSIASLTKIATTITAIENIKNLDEQITITSEMMNTVGYEASVAGLKAGDKVTYKDLLYASMLPSGADATNSLAISIFGSIDNYVLKMNEKVKEIGLKNTNFVNVSGLDSKEHYSTAADVRLLLVYALKNKTFREIYTSKEYKLSNGLLVKSSINHYNKNMKYDTSKILGSKTGFTYNAGYCLSSLTNVNGHEVLVLTLNASKKNNEFYNVIDTVKLIDFLNENYKDEVLVKKDSLVKTISVNLSDVDKYDVFADEDIKKYLPSDYNKEYIKIEYDGLYEINFTARKGKKIGTVSYYYKDELLKKQDVILDVKIKPSIKKILKKYIIFIILVIVLVILFLYKYSCGKKRKSNKKRK